MHNPEMRFAGIERVFGEAAHRIRKAHVLIVGLGGVGSWVAEALARTGIGTLTLVDPDDICVSNINRQVHALDSTVGVRKIEVMAARIRDISSDCHVRRLPTYVNESTLETVLDLPYDYVVDAIDGVMPKAGLIAGCMQRQLPIVTCGGSGGKINPALIQTVDLALTHNDRLLAFIRKKLRHVFDFPSDGPFGIPCVFSPEPVRWPTSRDCLPSDNPLLAEAGSKLNCDGRLGALCYVTGTFGFHLAAVVITSLTNGLDGH